MFLGLRTVVYPVKDLAAAKEWYGKILATQPYFDQPYYVGFSVGGFELGLHPVGSGVSGSSGGGIAYWGVEDIHLSHKKLLELGAVKNEEIQDVGEGIFVATVKDPFGNVLGIIKNPHFKY
jgi:predicted enzyme related to lactoylglutathione lyase